MKQKKQQKRSERGSGRLVYGKSTSPGVTILTPGGQSDVLTLSLSREVPLSDIVSAHFGLEEWGMDANSVSAREGLLRKATGGIASGATEAEIPDSLEDQISASRAHKRGVHQ